MFVSTVRRLLAPMGDGSAEAIGPRMNGMPRFTRQAALDRSVTMINGLDLLILFALAIFIGIGFFGGVARLVAMGIAIYLGTVAAERWYVELARAGHRHIHNFSVETGQFVVFVGLIVVTTLVLTPVVARGLGFIRFPRRVEIADNIFGAGLGVVALALSVIPMTLVLQALNQTVQSSGGSGAHSLVEQSALIPLFLRMAPLFVHLISPWFPSGLPPILTVVR